MAKTQITGDTIKDSAVTSVKIAASAVTSAKVDSSVAKVVSLTQAEYDALSSYDASTLYITTD